MSDSIQTSTLEGFISLKNTDTNIYYSDLSIFEKSIDGKNVLLSYNLLNDYKEEIMEEAVYITLTDEEYIKYIYQPKKLAYDIYGSTEYYYIILFVNSMPSIKEFSLKRIKLIRPNTLSNILSSIYSSEKEFLENNNEVLKAINEE